MESFKPSNQHLTKYLFFTGKGGVGKTSTACATAVALADSGKKIMLVSTDPASNLQDVFGRELTNKGTAILEVPGLTVANFDPISAANDYMESVVGPYRGLLPEAAIANMEEQLSGSCTVEIASFNEFAGFLTNNETKEHFDHILFDTAPTGHTLRMLQLPSAWSDFLDENTTGTSCMGQLSGLGDKQEMYRLAVQTLANEQETTLLLVTRPQIGPILEADRASRELREIGIRNQRLLVNGLLEEPNDDISMNIFETQQQALAAMPPQLKGFPQFGIPLRTYNVTGIDNLRMLLQSDQPKQQTEAHIKPNFPNLQQLVDDFASSNKKVIFTMGKGGVGKTTIAAAIATGLAAAGKKVHLATTDPAAHLEQVISESADIRLSRIDEKKELQDYTEEVLQQARLTMSEEDLAYIEEDLRSPCTQEIAVFRRFAEIVDTVDCDVVVIDTAPTGHTLLLLDSSQSYAKEVERSSGDVPAAVRNLLPVLQDPLQTEVVMVTWWVVNNSMLTSGTTNPVLAARAQSEQPWIDKVNDVSQGHFAVVEWSPIPLKGKEISSLLKNGK